MGVKFQAMLGADQLRLERFLMQALDGGSSTAIGIGSEPIAAAGGA